MNISNKIRSVVIGILSGNPLVEPMHYGVIFGTWANL